MAINEAEILRAFEKDGVGTTNNKIYSNAITELSKQIRKDFQKVIEKESKLGNGDLSNSVEVIPIVDGFEIHADFYYKFIDDGVSGVGQFKAGSVPSRSVVSVPEFSFKNLGVPKMMADSIRAWAGVPLSQAYAIGVNIKNYGIQPKNITEQVWNDKVIERVSTDLSRITGLAVTVMFDKNMND